MKVCFISPKAYSLFNPKIKNVYGGAEVQMFLLAGEFSKKMDIKVDFIVADYGQHSKETYSNIEVWKSFNLKENFFSKGYKLLKLLLKLKSDIYIQRTLTYFSGFMALLVRLSGGKFVYMVSHDSETDQTNKLYKNRFTNFFLNLTYKFSDLIVVQNRYEKRNLKDLISEDKIFILKKGLEISNNLSSKTKKLYDVIWIARSEEWKNPEVFIKLAKEKKHLKFLMICPKATDKLKYFEKIKKKASKILNLIFLGLIPYTEVLEYIRKSKVYCITSEKEGDWPMVVLEALSYGLPVLSYRLNYSKLLTLHRCGKYAEGVFLKLSEDLEEILKKGHAYKEMSLNAFKYVTKYHNIETNAEFFAEKLNSIFGVNGQNTI